MPVSDHNILRSTGVQNSAFPREREHLESNNNNNYDLLHRQQQGERPAQGAARPMRPSDSAAGDDGVLVPPQPYPSVPDVDGAGVEGGDAGSVRQGYSKPPEVDEGRQNT